MFIKKIANWYYSKKYPWFKGWYNLFPEGWFKAFGKYLLEDIDRELKYYGCIINIYDIKEKYGELRIYFDCDYSESIWNEDYDDEAMANLHRCADAIDNIVEAYTHISRYTCCYCGKLDTPISSFSGYILPICEKCCKECKEVDLIFNPVIKDYSKNWTMPDYYKYETYSKESDKFVETTVNIKSYIDKIRKVRKG